MILKLWEVNLENVILMVMKTTNDFGEKSKTQTLTEYEMLMYEQCCNLVAAFARQQNTIAQAQQLGLDRALHNSQEEHEKWENEKQNRSNRKAPPRDAGTDTESGGTNVAV